MEPYPAFFMCGTQSWHKRQALKTFKLKTRLNSSTEILNGFSRFPPPPPALFIKICIPPNSATVVSTRLTKSSSSSTLQRTAIAFMPSSRISLAVFSASSALKSAMTILAPALAKSTAVALPIPLAPPVTIAVFPVRSNNASNSIVFVF